MFKDAAFQTLLKALKRSQQAKDVPIAALMELDGVVLKPYVNRVYEKGDHLCHAEILALKAALKKAGVMDFKNHKAVLYSTLEPCCMCLAFASLVRVSKVVYYAEDAKFGGVARIYTLNSALQKPELLYIEKKEVLEPLSEFFKQKR